MSAAPPRQLALNLLLVRAADSGRLDDLLDLLDEGADPKAEEHRMASALMRAVWRRRLDCAEALIPLSDVQARNGEGRSALALAAWRRAPDIVKALLPRSDPLAASDDGSTALILAACVGCHESAALLLPCSDADALDADGMSARDWAAFEGHARVADLIDEDAPRRLALAEAKALAALCSEGGRSGKGRL